VSQCPSWPRPFSWGLFAQVSAKHDGKKQIRSRCIWLTLYGYIKTAKLQHTIIQQYGDDWYTGR